MTALDITYILGGMTESDRYEAINQMPISYAMFADQTSLYGRAYGVLTNEDRGVKGPNDEEFNSFVANRCLRNAIYRILLQVIQETERNIGYSLSERYVIEKLSWAGQNHWMLNPGLNSLEVVRNWYDLSTLVDIDYYVKKNIPLFTDPATGAFIARVDSDLVENPADAVIRRDDNTMLIPPHKGHPRYAEFNADDWLVPLTTNVVDVILTDQINLQHKRYVRVKVTKPSLTGLTAGGTLYPVYPGTNQIIPHTIIEEDDLEVTYQFLIYVLVEPSFADETVSWTTWELYKFYRQIEIRYRVEEAFYLTLTWVIGDDIYTYTYDPDAADATTMPRLKPVIADAGRGVIHLYANDALVTDLTPLWAQACKDRTVKQPERATISVSYKTSTLDLLGKHNNQIDTIKRAIIARVAAELPTVDCGCPTKIGFIAEQQKQYGSVFMNPYTGIEATKVNYGERHGQLVYQDIMQNVLTVRRPVSRIGKVV